MLREENLKWKLQREELENEISKLKKASTTVKSQKTSNDADLTAFIKDLKESADTLSTSGRAQGKRTSTSAYASNNNTSSSNGRFANNVRL